MNAKNLQTQQEGSKNQTEPHRAIFSNFIPQNNPKAARSTQIGKIRHFFMFLLHPSSFRAHPGVPIPLPARANLAGGNMQIEGLKFDIEYKKPTFLIKRFTRRYTREDLFLEEDLIFLEDLDDLRKSYFLKKKG